MSTNDRKPLTEADKERILDIMWRAMSAAVGGEAIPIDAQLVEDEVPPLLGRAVVDEEAE